MQEERKEMLPESQHVRQDKQDLSFRLAALESKLENNTICYMNNLITVHANQKQWTHFPYNSFKKGVPRFDGTNPFSWIFKINQFFNFHNPRKDARITIASSVLMEQRSIGINRCSTTVIRTN